MVSGIARRLIGEAEFPPPHFAASDWFSRLSSQADAVRSSGTVKHLELEAIAIMVRDDPESDESTEHVATWDEYSGGVTGTVNTVHFEGSQITGYGIYARHTADQVSHEKTSHISDHQTHREAEVQANALAAVLGVRVIDFSIATGTAYESYGSKFISGIVKKALKPYLKINFLDGEKEEIGIKLDWESGVFYRGGSMYPGLVAKPSPEQLHQVGGKIGGRSGGEFAMEVINNVRYEGGEKSGFLHDDPEEARMTAEETPDLYYRPLKFEFCNEGEPPDRMTA